jgi:hypothetical protein
LLEETARRPGSRDEPGYGLQTVTMTRGFLLAEAILDLE